jgi:hypothetical protein
MESIFAVIGFWIFAIVAVVKWGDVRRARAMSSGASIAEIESLRKRVNALEQELGLVTHQMIELKEERDFASKLVSKDRAN